MSIERKILSEIERYKSINRYLNEQDAPPPPLPPGEEVPPTPGEVPAPGGEAGAPPVGAAPAEPIDVAADDEVEKIDEKGKSQEEGDDTETLDITDLVKSQENIETKQEEYFQNLFSQLTNLETKLKEMDMIVSKLNTLENKIEKYREKSPQEKLELRTYDSYPFNQKLSDFFDDKQADMEKTGKNEYVLTTDDVTDISDNEIKDTFLPNS